MIDTRSNTSENGRPPGRWARRLLLFRLSNWRVDFALTLAAVGVVAWVRFAHLANGPWEWDEAAFARAILDFNLAAYFPHPPGYPGWIALGHVFDLFAPEPLAALQWASAAFSVVALWPLASLGRRVAAPSVAVAAALVVLLAPGPSLYAVRGFSSTTAAVLALAAAAVAAGGLGGSRPTVFTVLVAAGLLVRPNLLPPLAVLWLGVAWTVRPRRQLVPGCLIALAMGGLALAAMAVAEGGLGQVVEVFASHSERHFSRLVGNLGGIGDLGLVKGLGGGLWAAALLAGAGAGLHLWWRRVGRRSALLWVAVLGVAIGQLVWMQNRTYCRYAVGVQMAIAPLLAATAAVAPPVAGCGALLAGAAWSGLISHPPVVEQHRGQLAAWRAVQAAEREAGRRGMAVVVESEMHLFASYLWLRDARRGVQLPPRVLTPWDPEPWRGVDRPYLVTTVHRQHYPPSIIDRELRWNGVSDRLRPLTQQRFLTAWVITAPPLPLGEWWPAEIEADGRWLMWGGAVCDLLLPPLPDPAEVEVAFRAAPGEAPLEVSWNGGMVAEVEADVGRLRLRFDADQVRDHDVNQLSFRRAAGYPPGNGDQRPLAVQLFHVRAMAPNLPWSASLAVAAERRRLGILLQGHHGPENFGGVGRGVWLAPHAVLEVPAAAGRLELVAWAPRPVPADAVIRVGGEVVAGPLDLASTPLKVVVPIAEQHVHGGRVTFEIDSVEFVPAAAGVGTDRRELGIVVSEIRFEPSDPPPWARPLDGGGA
jgi:hypothetical protein